MRVVGLCIRLYTIYTNTQPLRSERNGEFVNKMLAFFESQVVSAEIVGHCAIWIAQKQCAFRQQIDDPFFVGYMRISEEILLTDYRLGNTNTPTHTNAHIYTKEWH